MEVSEEDRSWRVGLLNIQEFSQVDRSGRLEAVVAQRERVCTVFGNQRAANGVKQDERYG